MNPTLSFLPLALLVLVPRPAPPEPAPASDPTGVYGLVDEVAFAPDEAAPTSVVLRGAFAVAEGRHGNYYRAARWGALSFSLPEEEDEHGKAREQWADLAKAAGSGEAVGFGTRWGQGSLRLDDTEPVPYSTGWGVHRTGSARYGAIGELFDLPRPVSPLGEGAIEVTNSKRPERKVTLVTRNRLSRDGEVKYLFEIERANGDRRSSPPIPAGDGETRWDAHVALKPGETVRWSVRVLREGAHSVPVAEASFTTALAGER